MLTLFRKPSFLLFILLLISGCSHRKNTPYTRWYQGFTTRYNGYYHAEKKYNEQITAIADRVTIPKGKDFAEFYFVLAPGNLLIAPEDADVFADVAMRCDKLIAKHSISKPPRRDRRKQTDINYQQYLRRKEYNPTMHHVWLLKQKALLLSGNTNEAIKAGRTIQQLFAHDTTTLIRSRVVSAVAYGLKGWIYAANNELRSLQYRPDAAYISETLRNHETYYLQNLERTDVRRIARVSYPRIPTSAVTDTIREVRLLLYPQETISICETLLYEINKAAMTHQRDRALQIAATLRDNREVVEVSSFVSHEEAQKFTSVLFNTLKGIADIEILMINNESRK